MYYIKCFSSIIVSKIMNKLLNNIYFKVIILLNDYINLIIMTA